MAQFEIPDRNSKQEQGQSLITENDKVRIFLRTTKMNTLEGLERRTIMELLSVPIIENF